MLNKNAVAQIAHDLKIAVNTDYRHRAQSQLHFQPALEGGAVFIQPPREHIEAHVLQYCHANSSDSTLAALLLIPEDSWKQYTDAFKLLATYPPGHKDWVTHPQETYSLWYDPMGHNQKMMDQVILTLKYQIK